MKRPTKLVEGSGHYDVKVRLVNLKDESPVMELNAAAEWSKPEIPMELGLNFSGIPVPEFGTYEFQLYANDVYVGRAVITATKIQLPPEGAVRGH
jgi:hypothetical protein